MSKFLRIDPNVRWMVVLPRSVIADNDQFAANIRPSDRHNTNSIGMTLETIEIYKITNHCPCSHLVATPSTSDNIINKCNIVKHTSIASRQAPLLCEVGGDACLH